MFNIPVKNLLGSAEGALQVKQYRKEQPVEGK